MTDTDTRRFGRGDGGGTAVADPPMTDAEEKLRTAAEERDREAAAKALGTPVGGIAPTRFRIQITGGAVELRPGRAQLFKKDTEVEITVAGVSLRGWVKTDTTTTEKKGGTAVREAVIVVEESEDTPQLRLDQDDGEE